MKDLTTDHWAYYYGRPVSTGLLKFQASDFVVEEELGYALSGEGEHQFLYVEKINTNTAFVAEQLARYSGYPLRQVSYSGRKDKYALTRQWFGIHTPGKPDIDFSDFALDGVKILTQKRHNKKLRTGQHRGNRFSIILRQVSHPEAIEQRLSLIQQHGVPNYYGEQRFGVMRVNEFGEQRLGGNLVMAAKMLQGEPIRHRNKRSMAISALRSWLFNEMLSQRIEQGTFDTLIPGDALQLTGSNSFFIHHMESENQLRYSQRDVCPTAPLWGEGELPTLEQAKVFEQNVAETNAPVSQFLQTCQFKQERRAIRIWPSQLEWQHKGDTLTLNFFLPSGCFATSVLRECMAIIPAQTDVSATSI